MRVGIVSSQCMAQTHGTGAQLLALFRRQDVGFFHLYWASSAFGKSEVEDSYLIEDPIGWRWFRGRRFMAALACRIGLSWWVDDRIRPRKLRSLVRRRGLDCDVVHAVVADEHDARRVLSLLEILDRPVVVQVLDILHPDGLDSVATPGFCELLRSASWVFALNPAIETEVLRCRGTDVEVLPFGRSPLPPARPPGNGRIRVLLCGQNHAEGLRVLDEAWPCLEGRAELVHSGPHTAHFPPTLRRSCRFEGYVSQARYEGILASSHLAFLSGPGALDCFGRFSMPSRLADFFMAGLPVLAHTAPGTTTETFLAPHVPAFVRMTRTAGQIVQGFAAFTRDDDGWTAAHDSARTHALCNLHIDTIRGRILARLSMAAGLSLPRGDTS